MDQWQPIVKAFYFTLSCAFIAIFVGTSYYHPLLPLKLDDLEWCKMWLGTTVIDYHVCATCMSAIAIRTDGWKYGGLWALGMNMIGCPIACFYIVYKISKGSTLELS